MTSFTKASELGAPLAARDTEWALAFPKTAQNQGLLVQPGGVTGKVTSFSLVYDVYFPSEGVGSWMTFFQSDVSNTSDGDLFGAVQQNAFGVGISSQYQGAASLDAWHRIAFTVEAGQNGSTLSKYIDGELIGTQTVPTDRFSVDAATGFLIMADNDGETAAGHLSSFLFTDQALSPATIAGLGAAKSGGILAEAPADGHALQFDFTDGALTASIGSGTLTPKNLTAVIETTVDAELPDLADTNDSGLLVVPASAGTKGFRVAPGTAADVSSYTLVFDLFVKAGDLGGYNSLFQTDLSNKSDGDFFIRAGDNGTFSLGISGDYEGTATLDAWHRIAVTIENNGDGTSTMSKFIDGTLVGEQSVDTARYTISKDGFLIFADEDGESAAGHLNSFLFADEVISKTDIAALGATDPDGILSQAPATGNATQFDFDNGNLTPTFGPGSMTDPSSVVTSPVEEPSEGVKRIGQIQDMMVTTDAANQTIDLKTIFSGRNLTYKVEVGEKTVVNPTITADGKLVLDFGELGFSDVRITATDESGTSVSDVFRARVAGENAYTIAVFPDTQNYTAEGYINHIFGDMTQWLVDNKDSHNIQFMIHVGDITNNNTAAQWAVAEEALRKLDGKIPYSLLPGNHDQASGGSAADHSSVYLDDLFSPDKQEATAPDNFGGTYDQETDSARNTYSTFTAPDGTKWLVLSMEFGPRDDILRWAGDVIEDHLDHRVIINSHSLTSFAGRQDPTEAPLYDEGAGYDYGIGRDPEGANDGETIYRELLAKYPNISMTFSGHIFGDGAETDVSYTQYGTPVFEFLVNYQNGVAREITGNGDSSLGGRGGNGAIRLVVIDPENNTVSTETYFTEFDDYLDGYRVKPELDRDGLTGKYNGHQETFTGVDFGTPEVFAMAKAGNDIIATAEDGAETSSVKLDATKSLNPKSEGLTYSWSDENGTVIATGASPSVDLAQGKHMLTLTVTDSKGISTTDKVLVVVKGDDTLLQDDFNDGNIDGWSAGELTDITIGFGQAQDFGIPALGTDQGIASIPALKNAERLFIAPLPGAPAGTKVTSYTLMMDIYVPSAGVDQFVGLFQTDVTNKSDGELFIKKTGATTGGIGISGTYEGEFHFDAWQRLAFVVTDLGNGNMELAKYINGVKVGTQSVDAARFTIDVASGALLFGDEDGENAQLYTSSVLLSDKAFSAAEIAVLGGAQAGGILSSQPTPYSSQFDFNGNLNATFGYGTIGLSDTAATGAFMVKGTVFSRPDAQAGIDDAPEGAVYDMSDASGNKLVWSGNNSESWSDYVYEVALQSTDNDAIGVVFYHQDEDNYYRFSMNGETNRRELVRVKDGVETVLASTSMGYRFNDEMLVKVAVVGNEITVFLDGVSVFNGPVVDSNALTHGTIGLYSSEQRSSIFDDVLVTKVNLSAHAGTDARIVDLDADGHASVVLNASSSFGPDAIVSYVWKDLDGNIVAEGKSPTVELAEGMNKLVLTVTDVNGKTSTDRVDIEVIGQDRVLASDDFSAGLSKWTIVDEGELGGIGANGKSSEWHVTEDGKLIQTTDLKSRELTWQGADNPDVWKEGWSPLGDGVNVLRLGTYALFNDPVAKTWDSYAVETTFMTPDDDGLGLLFHYQDNKNYYKLELDADGTYDRNPSNGAGSVFNLIRMRNGVEEILGQVPGKYEPGLATKLRVEIIDNKIQAYLNGEAIFAYPIEDHAHEQGTFGLYSWGNQGLTFDDVVVYDLGPKDDGGNGGSADDDILIGTDGNDLMEGGAGKDAILGGLGNDVIDGGSGDDTLIGNEGDDTLTGGEGADLLDGGEDDDTLSGGDGSDTYVYVRGSGSDVIIEGAGKTTDQDRLYLDDLGRNDVVIHRQGNDIVITIGAETITLKNQLSGGGIEVISFADGTALVGEQIAQAAVNRGPVVSAPAIASGAEDTRISGQIVASDADGDQLSYTVKTGFGPAHGAVLLNAATGTWTYDPAANYNGTDRFTVVVADGHGGLVEQVIDLSVTPVNDAPVAVDDVGSVGEGQTKVFNLLANDTDVDGNMLSLTGFTVVSVNGIALSADAAKSAFAIVDGKLSFTPGSLFADLTDGQHATLTLSYTVSDGTLTDTGSFTLTVDGEGEQQNVIIGTQGSNILLGTDRDDAISAYGGNDYAFGRDGADVIDGGDGNDYLFGGKGQDVINGGEGNDTLFGDAGDDVLIGDKGNDRMVGGEGADSFFFRAGFGHDTVMDFGGDDVIDLSTADFADFADVVEHLSETALGTMLTLDDGSTLTLANVEKNLLTADHFHLVA